jgi:protein Tex
MTPNEFQTDAPFSRHVAAIADELALAAFRVEAAATLLNDGASVPFIARYRKEATGSLDEVAIAAIRDRLAQLAELDTRRAAVLKSLEQNGHLDEALEASVAAAVTLAELEDLYLPYRPKRRTRAAMAREKGLASLAEALLAQTGIDPRGAAAAFMDAEKGVPDIETALAGARDIIAETVNEDAMARSRMRVYFSEQGAFRATVIAGKEIEGAKFKDYFDWNEPAAKAPSHRILAMRRGEKEEILNLRLTSPEDGALALLKALFVRTEGEDGRQVALAVEDGYRRLMSRAMETELRLATKQRADAEAIAVFAENLRQLLLAPPLGSRRIMGVDPGFRTGCKTVCLDRQGKLLHHETLFIHGAPDQRERTARRAEALVAEFAVEAVAVGNGTAGRETETFFRSLSLPQGVAVTLVNESGASIYSASEIAREEFPDLDLTVRGAISIGRRLMDPLAELVKIDPKSIGVGQYQHDVDPAALKQALDDVVVSCVNAVGVDANRASAALLTYVSGLGPRLAQNIVAHRDAHGPFRTRAALKDVPRLGPKAFEQAAGFLRIADGPEVLDTSAVHPERYPIVAAMAADLGARVADLMNDADLRRRIDINRYVNDEVGLPTLTDILTELAKPGRDPRRRFEPFAFAAGVEKIEDLVVGMRLPGIVTNVTRFGAFVDIGVHQDGLVHVSQMADRFVRDPAEVIHVLQKVKVRVLAVDLARRRIALSLREGPETPEIPPQSRSRAPERPPRGAKPSAMSPRQPFHNPFADVLKRKRP